jgi:uncharacterized protein
VRSQRPKAYWVGLAGMVCGWMPALGQQNPAGLAVEGTVKVADVCNLLEPGAVRLGGLLGERYDANLQNRLLRADEDELLGGFRHRPGSQAWIGEHVGKWLHAASLSCANRPEPLLRAKIDRVVEELLKTQEPDGYLGTYLPDKRWGMYPDADWDVWVHKYCLVGLLADYQFSQRKESLEAARRIGDLLVATFGPGKRSLLAAGNHVGMAATSVLEPMVLLYRATGEQKYLDFAKYIVAAWEEPEGPQILSTLLRGEGVNRVANGKAYEMLSNLCGLCELYRVTGEPSYLKAVLNAWDDIEARRLYITGSGSSGEIWRDEAYRPNHEDAHVCEVCVTATWEQLNLQLLRLLGEPRFAEQIERTVYNHLLAAQTPTGDDWCYYTPLADRKHYWGTVTCCRSSGPRGVALLPTCVYTTRADGLDVNLFTDSTATVLLSGGRTVQVQQQTGYPTLGTIWLNVIPDGGPQQFSLNLRVPAWATAATIAVNDERFAGPVEPGQFARIARTWNAGDRVMYRLDMHPRAVIDEAANPGRVALMCGPLVLAADEGHNLELRPLSRVALKTEEVGGSTRLGDAGPSDWSRTVFEIETAARDVGGKAPALRLMPFYAAGADDSPLVVWFCRSPGASSLFALGVESRSRPGNAVGSIVDEDLYTYVVTYDGKPSDQDWFAVSLPAAAGGAAGTASTPVTIDTVVYAHGRSFHDGGWFDTSGGKPRIQVRRTVDGDWEDIAALDSYPQTTGPAMPPLRNGQTFQVRFPPTAVCAVRIIGKPACGDRAEQAFSSCAELRAWLDHPTR